ncbi:MAG: hypothetical protein ACLFOC_10305 [Campylobacterales bacterium]
MTRVEHIKKVNENRRKKSDEKVQKIIKDNLFLEDYRKPNGKLNISKIARDANAKREVVYRVLG